MELRHSGLGIAAFVTSLVAAVLMFVVLMAAGVVETATPDGLDEGSPIAIVIGLAMMLAFMAEAVAGALAIANFFQRDRRKLFGILGLAVAIASTLGLITLVILGTLL